MNPTNTHSARNKSDRVSRIAFGVLLLAATACSAKLSLRIASVEGFEEARVEMSADDAALVDKMKSEAPDGDATVMCRYWKQRIAELQPAQRGALSYAERTGGGWCELAPPEPEPSTSCVPADTAAPPAAPPAP